MTLREVQFAEERARERMSAPRGGSWDIRRAPSWRRWGPKFVVRQPSWRRILVVISSAGAVSIGVGVGMLIANAMGMS